MSIHHDVVTVNLVPGKTSNNILLAKPLCLNSGGLPQLLQWFLSMEVGVAILISEKNYGSANRIYLK